MQLNILAPKFSFMRACHVQCWIYLGPDVRWYIPAWVRPRLSTADDTAVLSTPWRGLSVLPTTTTTALRTSGKCPGAYFNLSGKCPNFGQGVRTTPIFLSLIFKILTKIDNFFSSIFFLTPKNSRNSTRNFFLWFRNLDLDILTSDLLVDWLPCCWQRKYSPRRSTRNSLRILWGWNFAQLRGSWRILWNLYRGYSCLRPYYSIKVISSGIIITYYIVWTPD